MKTLIFFLIFIISTLCCYSQTSMTGAPRQFAAPRASFNDIISIGELIKSVKEGNVGIKKIAEKSGSIDVESPDRNWKLKEQQM